MVSSKSPSKGLDSWWKCGENSPISCGESSAKKTDESLRSPQHSPFKSRLAPPNSILRVRSLVHGFVSPFVSCMQPLSDMGTPSYQDRDLTAWQQREERSVEQRERNAFLESSPLPLSNIETCHVHCNDVLCGRGHATTQHIGNRNFRDLIAANREVYAGLTRKQKQAIARRIVDMVHSARPAGRFLMRDSTTGLWNDIGMTRSLEKTIQALREAGTLQSDDGSSGIEDNSVAISTLSESIASASTTPASNNSQKKKHLQSIIIPLHLKTIFGGSAHGIPGYINPRSNNPLHETSEHNPAITASPIFDLVSPKSPGSFYDQGAPTTENSPVFQISPAGPTALPVKTTTHILVPPREQGELQRSQKPDCTKTHSPILSLNVSVSALSFGKPNTSDSGSCFLHENFRSKSTDYPIDARDVIVNQRDVNTGLDLTAHELAQKWKSGNATQSPSNPVASTITSTTGMENALTFNVRAIRPECDYLGATKNDIESRNKLLPPSCVAQHRHRDYDTALSTTTF